MAPPEHDRETPQGAAGDAPAVLFVAPVIETLRKRPDFLAAARARRQAMPGFILQARQRAEEGPIRIGFTCSKKVGNAVARNRAKRRLRAVARSVLTTQGRPGWDYVLIGRSGATAERPFAALLSDMATALDRLHQPGGKAS